MRAASSPYSLPAIVQPRSTRRRANFWSLWRVPLSRDTVQSGHTVVRRPIEDGENIDAWTRVRRMSADESLSPIDALTIPPPPQATPAPGRRRNTVGNTWTWLWKDTLCRVAPFALAGGWYLRHARRDVPPTHSSLTRELLLGVSLGLPMAGVASAFRAWVAPDYRLPTSADQALQTAFYFAVNAPAEEMFWRGMVQSATVGGLRRIPGLERVAPALGWSLATTAFGAYHRLGKWSWRSIAGVTVAGGLFGALYEFRTPSRRLLAPTLVHGFATAGFLSWGDAYLHVRARGRPGRRKA